MMMSVLTITAGMAATISVPQSASARSTQIENGFAKQFRLMMNSPARIQENGQEILGHIYLKLNQTKMTPEEQNQIHGEMSGTLYFESDKATSEDRQAKRYIPLIGEDGETMLDLINSNGSAHTYQIYGCNSSLTFCVSEKYQIRFNGPEVKLDLTIAEDLGVEILTTMYDRDENGKLTSYQEWSRSATSIHAIKVTTEEN